MSIIGGFGVPTPPSKKTPEEYPVIPWKFIAIAAIAATSILGLIAVTSLFNTNPAATTGSGWQPPPQPADPGGWIPPNEPDDSEASPTPTKAIPIESDPWISPNKPFPTPTPREGPDPDEIAYFETLIDISNLPKFIDPVHISGVFITDIKINKDNTIEAAYLNDYAKGRIAVRPIWIYFYDAQKNPIYRQQWKCGFTEEGDGYRYTSAHCQWPEDYCSRSGGNWFLYWREKNQSIPTIQPKEKYKFSFNCKVPKETKYLVFNDY